MSSKLIIVADLQRFKLFTSKVDPVGRESIELLQSDDSLNIHGKLSEKVSDQQGNFQGVGASGSGEDHNIAIEEEHRRIKEIAKQITKALHDTKHELWYFAAPKAINNQIVELLNPAIQQSMAINLHAELTKMPEDQVLEHFTK